MKSSALNNRPPRDGGSRAPALVRSMLWPVTAAGLSALLVACGGGGDAPQADVVAPTPPTVQPTGTLRQVFDATVDMAGSQPSAFQGMSVGIRTEDGQFWLRGQGFKDNARTVQSDPTSQYRIGSVTKSFTATAVLQLVDQNLLTLDNTVADILPNLASVVPNASTITVRNLLEMRSGLPDYLCQESLNFPGLGATVFDEWFESIINDTDANYTPEDLIRASFQDKFLCGAPTPQPPRGIFDYANVNYILLGRMAERASCASARGCRTIESLINEDIVARLRLTGTTFPTDRQFTSSNFAQASASGNIDVTFIGPKVPWASGAMLSTPRDMLVWARELALNESRLLSDASHQARKAAKPGALMGNVPSTYALGTYYLVSLGTGSSDLLGHSGSVATWTTSAFHSPSLRMSFAINMTRAGRTAPWFPMYGAGDAYGGQLRARFNPQAMLWSLERNLRLAVENTGTCSTLGPAVGNGATGSCTGDSVRTSALEVTAATLTVNPSGKVFDQANVVTVPNPNHWTGFDATLKSSPVPRPSLSFFGSGVTGVTLGNAGRVAVPAGALVETTGVGSSAFTLRGTGSELTLGGTVVPMGADSVAVRVADSARAARLTITPDARLNGDVVLGGEATVQLDGLVTGKVIVSGTQVRLTGSGRITGCIEYRPGATLAAGSSITGLTCATGTSAQPLSAPRHERANARDWLH